MSEPTEPQKYVVAFPHVREVGGQNVMFEPGSGVHTLPDDDTTRKCVKKGWLKPFEPSPQNTLAPCPIKDEGEETKELGKPDAPSDRVEHVRQNALHFVFDVESIGLHGEAFAVAGGLYTLDNVALWEFRASCPTSECSGNDSDRKWVSENVPNMDATHHSPRAIRDEFWKRWQGAKFQGARMAADCSWPVEAKFLEACIQDDELVRNWEGPYPLIDIGSVLLGAGYDPMKDYERTENELPKHEPLADARQSARLLAMALKAHSVSDRVSSPAPSVPASPSSPSSPSPLVSVEEWTLDHDAAGTVIRIGDVRWAFAPGQFKALSELTSNHNASLASLTSRLEEAEQDVETNEEVIKTNVETIKQLGATISSLRASLAEAERDREKGLRALEAIAKGPTRKNEARVWDNLALHGQDAISIANEAISAMTNKSDSGITDAP